MLDSAECIARSALMRKESRGAHTRSDFPGEKKEWLVNIVCRKSDKRFVFKKQKVKPMGATLSKLVGKPRPKVHLLE